RELVPKVDPLLWAAREPLEQLLVTEVSELLDGRHHSIPPMPARVTNLLLIGSLCAARDIASRASVSETPDSSNITPPGLTTATQPSGLPLPEPIRVSAGFFVTGLSGKMLIHTFPPRRMGRVIATRAASICRFVIHAASSATRPKSPKCTSVPPLARPRRRPRCTLRCLTFFGASISPASPSLASPSPQVRARPRPAAPPRPRRRSRPRLGG